MKNLILIGASLALMAVSAQAGGEDRENNGRGDPHDQVASYNLNANGNWNKNQNSANAKSHANATGIGVGIGIGKGGSGGQGGKGGKGGNASSDQQQGQLQGQAQKATNTTTITSNVEGSNYVGLDTPVCGNSAGGSNSQGAFGITFDSRNCNIRAEAALLNNIGLKVAAKKQTCFMRRVRNNSAMRDFCVGYNK